MRQYFLTLIAIFSLVACTSDDDNSSDNETFDSLIGQWFFEDPATNPTINNSFTFNSDGSVIYSYWDGTPGNNYDSETGSFSVDADILTMTFPENVTLTYVQRVNFINANIVEFLSTGVSGEEPYDGDYFRANPVDIEPPAQLKLIVTGTTFNDQCVTTGITLNNSYDVKLSFISDGTEADSQTFTGTNAININEDETMSGGVLKMIMTLQNFNANNPDAGKGTGVSDITVKIEDTDGNTLLDENIGGLLICMDTWYEVEFTYNKSDATFNSEFQTHGF